ncbi:MAG: GDSL family lipase [Clostridia bacterium]|nr:GDSL family lipase [Clostridia bacterium]
MKIFTPSYQNLKPLGRTQLLNETLWMAYSGSGAAFTFTGKHCSVTIAGDSTAADAAATDNQVRLAIEVNGQRVVEELIDAPKKTYTVFEADSAQPVEVRIIKLSESAMSTCAIKQIAVDTEDRIYPAADKPHRIEIVGDSITCGYGTDDLDGEHHFVTGTEDTTKAYAYKTAQALNADYSLVSLSGYGIISGYTATAEEKVDQILPRYYDKLGFSYGNYLGMKPQEIDWRFDFTPELIIINLGTNDDSYCLDHADRQLDYRQNYTAFLKKVRSHNPDAKILCVLGMMGDRLYPAVEAAAADYTAQTGDSNIACMPFPVQLAEDGYAADWHPSIVTHDKAAARLTAFVKELMRW